MSDNEDEPIDEWQRFGDLLGDEFGLIASPTRLGRMLRRAAILLAEPDTPESVVEELRRLTAVFERHARSR